MLKGVSEGDGKVISLTKSASRQKKKKQSDVWPDLESVSGHEPFSTTSKRSQREIA